MNESLNQPTQSASRCLRALSRWVGQRWLVVLLAAACAVLAGCGAVGSASAPAAALPAAEEAEEVELAVLMGEMQRHSAKLGYAIAGHNEPLVAFYLHEVEEVLGEVMKVETYEGMPIAHPAQVIMVTALEALEERFHSAEPDVPIDWQAAWQAYETTIEACNRCHLATEHGFIEILPARGEPPYNQRFAADPDVTVGE